MKVSQEVLQQSAAARIVNRIQSITQESVNRALGDIYSYNLPQSQSEPEKHTWAEERLITSIDRHEAAYKQQVASLLQGFSFGIPITYDDNQKCFVCQIASNLVDRSKTKEGYASATVQEYEVMLQALADLDNNAHVLFEEIRQLAYNPQLRNEAKMRKKEQESITAAIAAIAAVSAAAVATAGVTASVMLTSQNQKVLDFITNELKNAIPAPQIFNQKFAEYKFNGSSYIPTIEYNPILHSGYGEFTYVTNITYDPILTYKGVPVTYNSLVNQFIADYAKLVGNRDKLYIVMAAAVIGLTLIGIAAAILNREVLAQKLDQNGKALLTLIENREEILGDVTVAEATSLNVMVERNEQEVEEVEIGAMAVGNAVLSASALLKKLQEQVINQQTKYNKELSSAKVVIPKSVEKAAKQQITAMQVETDKAVHNIFKAVYKQQPEVGASEESKQQARAQIDHAIVAQKALYKQKISAFMNGLGTGVTVHYDAKSSKLECISIIGNLDILNTSQQFGVWSSQYNNTSKMIEDFDRQIDDFFSALSQEANNISSHSSAQQKRKLMQKQQQLLSQAVVVVSAIGAVAILAGGVAASVMAYSQNQDIVKFLTSLVTDQIKVSYLNGGYRLGVLKPNGVIYNLSEEWVSLMSYYNKEVLNFLRSSVTDQITLPYRRSMNIIDPTNAVTHDFSAEYIQAIGSPEKMYITIAMTVAGLILLCIAAGAIHEVMQDKILDTSAKEALDRLIQHKEEISAALQQAQAISADGTMLEPLISSAKVADGVPDKTVEALEAVQEVSSQFKLLIQAMQQQVKEAGVSR